MHISIQLIQPHACRSQQKYKHSCMRQILCILYISYLYRTVLIHQSQHPDNRCNMQQQEKQVKIEQEYACPICGKIFTFAEELKIHQYSKHGPPAQKRINLNQSQSNEQDTAKSPEPTVNKRKSTRQKTREQSKRQNEIYSKVQNKLIEQKADSESQQHSQNEHPQNNQPTLVIPQSSPVTPTDDIYQKIYLCGCTNKFFDNKQGLSLHIKKQHLGFPPDGTLIGVSKQLVLKQFKPIQQPPKHAYRQQSNLKHKHAYRFICGCGSKFTLFDALGFHIKKKHNGSQPQGTIGGLFRPPLEFSEDEQIDKSQTSNNQTAKNIRKICSFCRNECTGRIMVCRDCENWKYCGKCHLGALSREKHIQSGHRLYTI